MQKVTLKFDNPEIEAILFDLSKKNNSNLSAVVSSIIENFIYLYPNINKHPNTTGFIAKTAEGKNMSKKELEEHIYSIQDNVKKGNFIEHSKMLEEIENE